MRIDCKILPSKKKNTWKVYMMTVADDYEHVPSGDIERRQKRNEMDQEKS